MWLHSFWVKAFTFSACLPRLPSIKRGKPTITFLTCCRLIISVIDSTSAISSLQLIIVNGLANLPSGSLRATPIRLSPISSPKLRVICTSRLWRLELNYVRSSLSFEIFLSSLFNREVVSFLPVILSITCKRAYSLFVLPLA